MPPPALKHAAKNERSSSVPRCSDVRSDGLAEVPVGGEGAARSRRRHRRRGPPGSDRPRRPDGRRPARGSEPGRDGVRRPATGCSRCGTPPTGRRGIRRRPPPATAPSRRRRPDARATRRPPVRPRTSTPRSRCRRDARPATPDSCGRTAAAAGGRGSRRRAGRRPRPDPATRSPGSWASPLVQGGQVLRDGIGLASGADLSARQLRGGDEVREPRHRNPCRCAVVMQRTTAGTLAVDDRAGSEHGVPSAYRDASVAERCDDGRRRWRRSSRSTSACRARSRGGVRPSSPESGRSRSTGRAPSGA